MRSGEWVGEKADAVPTAAKATSYDAWLAGRVRKDGGRKAVVVPSLDLTFEGDTLQLRQTPRRGRSRIY